MRLKKSVDKIDDQLAEVAAVFDLIYMNSCIYWSQQSECMTTVKELEKTNFSRNVELCFESLKELCKKYDPATFQFQINKIGKRLDDLTAALNASVKKNDYDYRQAQMLADKKAPKEPIGEMLVVLDELKGLAKALRDIHAPISGISMLVNKTPDSKVMSDAEIALPVAAAKSILRPCP